MNHKCYCYLPHIDYNPNSVVSSVTFQPIDTEFCLNVTIIDDIVALEPEETVILGLSYFTGSGTHHDQSTVTIVDDDGEISASNSSTIFIAQLHTRLQYK